MILNIVASLLNFLIGFVFQFWLTKIIITNLGVELYGFVPLTNSIINYLNFVTIVFTSMIARFFTVSYLKKNIKEASSYLSTSLWSLIFLGFLIELIFLIIASRLSSLIEINPNHLVSVTRLFIIQSVVYVLHLLSPVFGVAPFCKNKLYIRSFLSLFGTIIKAISIVGLLYFVGTNLEFVGIGNLLSAIFIFIFGFIVFKFLLPEIKLSFKLFRVSYFYEIFSFGVWSAVNSIGIILYLQSDLLLANKLLGTTIAGNFAVLVQMQSFIRALVNAVSSNFSPTFMFRYSLNEIKLLIRDIKRSMIFLGIVLSIPLGIVGGMSKTILNLWLGTQFVNLSFEMSIIMCSIGINCGATPLFAVMTTYKKIRFPSIIQLIIGVLNIILAILFVKIFEFGMIGIIISGFITYSFVNFVMAPIYCAYIMKVKLRIFYITLFRSAFINLFSIGLFSLVGLVFRPDSWGPFILYSFVASVIMVLLIVCIFLNQAEKDSLKIYLQSIKMKLVKFR